MLAGVSLIQPMNLGELEGTQLMLAAISGQTRAIRESREQFRIRDEREAVLHQTGAKSVRCGGEGFSCGRMKEGLPTGDHLFVWLGRLVQVPDYLYIRNKK